MKSNVAGVIGNPSIGFAWKIGQNSIFSAVHARLYRAPRGGVDVYDFSRPHIGSCHLPNHPPPAAYELT